MTDRDPELLADGRYAVLRELGSGAQASTLEAIDKRFGRLVAIKRFRIKGANWKDIELAEREARVLSSLSHPLVPAYIDHFEHDGSLYLVTEKVEGQSLLELKRQKKRLGQDEVVRFLASAGHALDYLHSRAPPVIHRDIKPSNVIQKPDGSYVFIDFGAVRDSLKPEGGSTVVGTFGYMAPEQFQGRAQPGSDVYAVGATALTLLSGCEPDALPHRGLAIDVRAALSGLVDERLVRVLERMLDPDPDRRAIRILPLLEQDELSGRPPRRPRGAARRRAPARHTRRSRHSALHPLLFFIAMLGLSIASIAVWWLFEFFLPMLLSVLSIFFGRSLRRTAHTLTEVGRQGRQGLRSARHALRRRVEEDERVRVSERTADAERYRVGFDAADTDEDGELDAEENQASARRPARRSREPGP
jgi:serine/threonine protein kinase